jgi:hypothetical protein
LRGMDLPPRHSPARLVVKLSCFFPRRLLSIA